jgi:hypothetical protein
VNPVRLALALAALGLLAGPARGEERVPVYTNADLAKFGPPTSAPGAPVTAPPVDPGVVQAFLDQQYARIDADRRLELERRQADREAAAQEYLYDRESYYMPYSNLWPYYGGGYGDLGFGGVGPGFTPCPTHVSLYPGSSGLTGAETQRLFLNQRPTIHGSPPLRQPQPPRTRPGHGGHGGQAGQSARPGQVRVRAGRR